VSRDVPKSHLEACGLELFPAKRFRITFQRIHLRPPLAPGEYDRMMFPGNLGYRHLRGPNPRRGRSLVASLYSYIGNCLKQMPLSLPHRPVPRTG